MRLLDSSKIVLRDYQKVKEDLGVDDVPFAILSHRWLPDEVTYEDIPVFEKLRKEENSQKGPSVTKVERFCRAASSQRYGYVWMDTCCIDQKNPVELSTAINSMYRWYKSAEVCFVYLHDYDLHDESSDAMKSEWFTRGWTLQELIAPKVVKFFDKNWKHIGNRHDEKFQDRLSRKTGIDKEILSHRKKLGATSVANRMSWYKNRITKVPEDSAYCLMGLFGVNMPTLYGEGIERAFRRLQEEIMRYSDDHSLFAWTDQSPTKGRSGLLARSPKCFEHTGKYLHKPNRRNNSPYSMTNKGLSIDLCVMEVGDRYIASLDCPEDDKHSLGIYLKCENRDAQQYSRIDSHLFCRTRGPGEPRKLFITQPIDI